MSKVTSEDKEYFKNRRVILEREVKELAEARDFDEIEDAFFSYGKFLQRHPEAATV